MKKSRRINFTLIELLAAMAVFSILLVVSMRLFSGAQQIWMRSEQKTDTFASARTAMEFIASRMQTIYYHNDEPFEIIDDEITEGRPEDGEMDSIWFISNMPDADGSKHLHFVKFRLENPTGSDPRAGMLQLLKYMGDKNYQTYSKLFPPYTGRRGKTYDKAVDRIKKVFEKIEDKDDLKVDNWKTGVDIIENVVGFKLRRFPVRYSGIEVVGLDTEKPIVESAPYLIEVELRILDSRESFLRWKNNASERDEIFAEHGYTFQRAILLGKKGSE